MNDLGPPSFGHDQIIVHGDDLVHPGGKKMDLASSLLLCEKLYLAMVFVFLVVL